MKIKTEPKYVSELLKRYGRVLFNTSYRIVNSAMDAEEIVHDTLLKFLRFPKELSEEQREAWLKRTCTRGSIDKLRERSRFLHFADNYKEEMGSEIGYDDSMVWEEIMDKGENERLVEAIKREMGEMPEGYRVILSLFLLEGYDYREIAEILNIKESTVRSQYLRGKNRLAERVKHNYHFIN